MRNTICAMLAAALLAAAGGCQSMPMLVQPDSNASIVTAADPIPDAPLMVDDQPSNIITDPPGTVIENQEGVVYEDGGYGDTCYSGDACGGAYGGWGQHQGRCGLAARNNRHVFRGPHGPMVGQVTYPYYTIRGPRDFLRDNPPSLGP